MSLRVSSYWDLSILREIKQLSISPRQVWMISKFSLKRGKVGMVQTTSHKKAVAVLSTLHIPVWRPRSCWYIEGI